MRNVVGAGAFIECRCYSEHETVVTPWKKRCPDPDAAMLLAETLAHPKANQDTAKKTPGAESHSTLRVPLAYSVRFLGELCSKRNQIVTDAVASSVGTIATAIA
jgi:hypothetical protein